MAWLDDATRKAWQARGGPASSERDSQLDAELTAARRRGYVVTAKSTPQASLARIIRELPETTSRHELHQMLERSLADIPPVEYFVGDETLAEHLVIESVQAPVFENGESRFALTIPVDQELGAADLRRLGRRAREAADAITGSIATLNEHRLQEPAGRA